jgi:antagonist of KipI
MEIKIIRSGMLTTVQDRGRRGHRASGVPLGGAMDAFALRVANLLVGNPDGAAALEFALVGPTLEFSADTIVALGGGEFEGMPVWTPRAVRAGERLELTACRRGCRGYLAIAGGIDVPPVLGSRSTYLRAGFGGLNGRVLREGNVLAASTVTRRVNESEHWRIDERILPPYSAHPTVRVLRGAQAAEFGDTWLTADFKVSPQSDRMGLRLTGPALRRATAADMVSMAVAPGTVQAPPDGQPIVLMAEAQTIGGYPQLAHVIEVDLPLLAQVRPGDTVRFAETTLTEAHRLRAAREHTLAMLHEGLAQKFH